MFTHCRLDLYFSIYQYLVLLFISSLKYLSHEIHAGKYEDEYYTILHNNNPTVLLILIFNIYSVTSLLRNIYFLEQRSQADFFFLWGL